MSNTNPNIQYVDEENKFEKEDRRIFIQRKKKVRKYWKMQF